MVESAAPRPLALSIRAESGAAVPASALLQGLDAATEFVDPAFEGINLAALLRHITALPFEVRGGLECLV